MKPLNPAQGNWLIFGYKILLRPSRHRLNFALLAHYSAKHQSIYSVPFLNTPMRQKRGGKRGAAKEGQQKRSDRFANQSSNGDQAGSEAKLGVAIRRSLRPVRSIEYSMGPPLAPGDSLKNINTRPFGAHVGPSL